MVYLRAGLRNRRPNNLLRGIAGCTVFRWSAPLSVTPASRKTSVPENLSVLTSQGPPTRARVQAHRHVKTYRPQWIEQQIRESDFVLMVCTETYYRRVRGANRKLALLFKAFSDLPLVAVAPRPSLDPLALSHNRI
jgi:hypothetical protein